MNSLSTLKDADEISRRKIAGMEEKFADERKRFEEKLKEEHAETIRMTKLYQSLLKKRKYYQFPTRNCFYIWKYADGTGRHKIGITTNINDRLATERTIAPDLRLIYIVYLTHSVTLEQFMLNKFEKHRLELNHEVIHGVSSEELCYAVSRYLEIAGHKYDIESHLLDYNQEAPEEMHEDIKAAVITNILNKEASDQEQQAGRFSCTWAGCSKSFSKKCHMYRHIRQTHEKSEQIECSECDEILSCGQSLKSHMETKHSNKKLKCKVCGSELANKSSLRRHMLGVHSDQGKIPCPVCKKLVHKTNLDVHIKRIHEKSIKFPCEYCGKILASKLNLDNHVANVCRKRPSLESNTH